MYQKRPFFDREILLKRININKRQEPLEIPVIIRDLVVLPENEHLSYGESRKNNNLYQTQSPLERLVDQIELLAKIAQNYHQKTYCYRQGQEYVVHKKFANTITRLSLCEFTLYTKTPLSVSEFDTVVKQIEKIAQTCHENVHLLLSSFAVISEAGELLNLVVYVQGGKLPQIKVITKASVSDVDISFPEIDLYAQQRNEEKPPKAFAFIAHHQPKYPAVSSDSFFIAETAGGLKFWIAVDICLDLFLKHSKRLAKQRLCDNASQLYPEQVDHVGTSNSIDLFHNGLISESFLRVDASPDDAFLQDFWDSEDFKKPAIKNPSITNPIFKPEIYKNLKIVHRRYQIGLVGLPFGSNMNLKVYRERQLGGFSHDLEKMLKKRNKRIKSRQCFKLMQAAGLIDELSACSPKGEEILELTQQLKNKLLELCFSSTFEWLFPGKNYFKKIDCRAAITAAYRKLETPMEEFFLDPLNWGDELLAELRKYAKPKYPFVKEMIKNLQQYLYQLEDVLMPSDSLSVDRI